MSDLDSDLMADIDFRIWFEASPLSVQAAILRCPPNRRYRLKATGAAWYAIAAYSEQAEGPDKGKVTLMVDRFSPFGDYVHTVFGVPPENLIPVDESQPMALGPAS